MFNIQLQYTTAQKFVVRFWNKSPKLHLFDQKYSKNFNIVKYDSNLK